MGQVLVVDERNLVVVFIEHSTELTLLLTDPQAQRWAQQGVDLHVRHEEAAVR